MAPQLPFQIIFNPPKWGIHGVVLETLQHPATTRLYIHVSALMAIFHKPLNYPRKERLLRTCSDPSRTFLLCSMVKQCGYGSIPIHTMFSGMNIHLPKSRLPSLTKLVRHRRQ